MIAFRGAAAGDRHPDPAARLLPGLRPAEAVAGRSGPRPRRRGAQPGSHRVSCARNTASTSPCRCNTPIWFGALVQGDFGTSIRTRLPIGAMLADKLPVTIELACLSMLFALVIGLPAGIFAALRRGTAVDYGTSVLGPRRAVDPEFLARHHADPAVLDPSRLAARRGLRQRFGESAAQSALAC